MTVSYEALPGEPARPATAELRAALVNDLLSSDGQRRPGDETLSGLGAALKTLDKDIRLTVAASLYGRAVEALNHADNAENEAIYSTADLYRESWLNHAERAARLWREACHAV